MQTIGNQPALLDCSPTIVSKRMILNVSYDQTEILRNIAALHNGGKPFELDVTYSTGMFYEKFPQPKYKFDLNPQVEGVEQADCRELPLPDTKVGSMIFDPPFVISGDVEKPTGKITKRFSGFTSWRSLADMYQGAIREAYRVLKQKGLLVVKCQDTVAGGKNYQTTFKVCEWAQNVGFLWKDTFFLVNDRLLRDNRWKNQEHARKAVSCFFCFIRR